LPAAPVAKAISVSDVEVSPSTVIALKVRAATSLRIARSNAGDTAASVKT
jgi:hypothetical protein